MQPVTLPHDAMLYEKRSKDAATAGACGYFPGGAYVYVKRFLVPETWRTQSAVLEFEAVYQNAQVFVNGLVPPNPGQSDMSYVGGQARGAGGADRFPIRVHAGGR